MLCIKAVPEKREILYHKAHISVISYCYKHTDFQIPIGLMISSSIFLKQSSFSGSAAQFDLINAMRSTEYTFHRNDPKTGKGSTLAKYDMQKISFILYIFSRLIIVSMYRRFRGVSFCVKIHAIRF
jgi:hypothetical protein